MKKEKIIKITLGLFLFLFIGMVGVNATLEEGLQAFYNPELNNNWIDLSSNNFNGISHGQNEDKTYFNGIDSRIELASSDQIFGVNPSSWSFGLTFKITETPTGRLTLISDYYSGSGSDQDYFLELDINSDRSLKAGMRYNGASIEVTTDDHININEDYDVRVNGEKGERLKIYLNGVLVKESNEIIGYNDYTNDENIKLGTIVYSGGYIQNYKGYIKNMALYNRELSQSEITELYNNGGNPIIEPVVSSSTQQTFSEIEVGSITINDTNWHTVLDGNFTINVDDTPVYDEATLYTMSNTDNMPIRCRTLLNEIEVNNKLLAKINNGTLTSMSLMSENVTALNAAEYNIKFQCKNEILGETMIGAAIGIGNVLKTFGNETINHDSDNNEILINSGVSPVTIATASLTALEDLSNYKYLIMDWNAIITNNHTQAQTITISPRVSDHSGTPFKACREPEEYLEPGETKSIGGSCLLEAEALKQYFARISGTGINVNYNGIVHFKEFNYELINEAALDEKTFYTIPGTTSGPQLIEEREFETNIQNAKVVVKGTLTVSSEADNLVTGYIEVLNDENIVYTTQPIAMTTNTDLTSVTFQTSIPIQSGTNKFRLYLEQTLGNNVTFKKINLVGYSTQQLDFVENSFDIRAFEFWDNAQLSNFSAVIGNTTYSTTGNTINAIGQTPYQNILINKENYISRLYQQHDTTLDLNTSIGQHQADFTISEKYTNNTINNFSLETDIGTFSTTNGKITIFPLEAIYNNWNITTDTYYNKSGLQFQVGGSLTELNTPDFIDKILTFVDEDTNPIYPECTWLGNTINTTYEIASQNELSSELSCRLNGHVPFVGAFTTPFPETLQITMPFSRIIINIFDRVTGDTLNQLTNVNIGGLTSGTTSNGTITFLNSSFLPGTYTVTASSSGYFTEQKEFSYNGEQEVEASLYLLDTTFNQSSTLIATVVDSFTHFLPGANLVLEEFDTTNQNWKQVGQCTSNSDGECQFLVEVGEKRYRVYASKLINGVLQDDYTVEDGEIFKPEISNGQIIYGNTIVRTLTLKSVPSLTPPVFKFLNVEYPADENATITFVNDSRYLISIPITFSSTNNLDYEVCLEFYKIERGQEIFFSKECTEGASGTIPGFSYVLDRNLHNLVKITARQGDNYKTVKEYNYISNNSLFYILNQSNYVPSFILLLWIAALAISVYSGNISIFVIATFFLSVIQLSFFPNFINIAGTILNILIGLTLFKFVRKKEDNL